jgi:Tol biopolymer transport system component
MSPERCIAHYRITAKLGEGGMGEVWRATDTKLNREVAIKVLPAAFAADPDRLSRFVREAQVLASLNHPNIAAIYGVEEGALVMELVEGPTLAGRIAQGPIPLDEALPMARQIAEAIEYAHERGVIHRDLKPANIKITPEGRVKVLDFGLAKAMSGEGTSADPINSPTLTMGATTAGVILGTASYMAPEQAKGKPADRRADIWAFGVILAEMLTGRVLYTGETVSDVLASVIKDTPALDALPAATPLGIRRLLRRCLERDPRRRLQAIGEARFVLEEPEETAPAAPGAPATAVASGRGPGWANVALATLALAGIALGVVHFRESRAEAIPVRFEIPAPENAFIANGGIAISPDGRRIAFVASAGTGPTMVWVRPLDSLEARALPGTENTGFAPFWSPDSRFIGFGAAGALKKVDARGGPTQTLCEITSVIVGGSWSIDGFILFSSATTAIYRVPQAGGVPELVTALDEAKGELGHLRPWFLPDGRHFFYSARMSSPDQSTLYLASIDGKERRRLLVTRQAGAYAPPAAGAKNGHLLFLRGTTLMAQPMDPDRLELAGESFPVAEHVGSVLGMGWFSVSANGVLVYRSGASAADQVAQLSWHDRAGKQLGALGQPTNFTGGMELSPDGSRVATEEMDASGNHDIWIRDVARGVPTRFTFDQGYDREPHWSPDGSRVAFASDRGHGGRYSIYVKPSNGSGNEELLLDDSASSIPGAWSPSGAFLIYQRSDQKDARTGLDLWTLPLPPAKTKPEIYLQTVFAERQPQFSPDGRWVAYISNESVPSQYQVYVQPFPPGGGKFQISTGTGGTEPRWRRDGKEIFYLAADGKLMAVEVKTTPRFEPGSPQALFDAHAIYSNPTSMPVNFKYDVSPDGRRFLVERVYIPVQQNATAPPIIALVNWQTALKQ